MKNDAMKMNLEILKSQYRKQILAIAEICNAENVRAFGSVTKGELAENSDIDFLVNMKLNSRVSIGGLQWRLEESYYNIK